MCILGQMLVQLWEMEEKQLQMSAYFQAMYFIILSYTCILCTLYKLLKSFIVTIKVKLKLMNNKKGYFENEKHVKYLYLKTYLLV